MITAKESLKRSQRYVFVAHLRYEGCKHFTSIQFRSTMHSALTRSFGDHYTSPTAFSCEVASLASLSQWRRISAWYLYCVHDYRQGSWEMDEKVKGIFYPVE